MNSLTYFHQRFLKFDAVNFHCACFCGEEINSEMFWHIFSTSVACGHHRPIILDKTSGSLLTYCMYVRLPANTVADVLEFTISGDRDAVHTSDISKGHCSKFSQINSANVREENREEFSGEESYHYVWLLLQSKILQIL